MNSRLILNEECMIASTQTEEYKQIMSGVDCMVNVKNKPARRLTRTPTLFTCNTMPWTFVGQYPIYESRCKIYQDLTAQDWIPQYKRKIHPLGWLFYVQTIMRTKGYDTSSDSDSSIDFQPEVPARYRAVEQHPSTSSSSISVFQQTQDWDYWGYSDGIDETDSQTEAIAPPSPSYSPPNYTPPSSHVQNRDSPPSYSYGSPGSYRRTQSPPLPNNLPKPTEKPVANSKFKDTSSEDEWQDAQGPPKKQRKIEVIEINSSTSEEDNSLQIIELPPEIHVIQDSDECKHESLSYNVNTGYFQCPRCNNEC